MIADIYGNQQLKNDKCLAIHGVPILWIGFGTGLNFIAGVFFEHKVATQYSFNVRHSYYRSQQNYQ